MILDKKIFPTILLAFISAFLFIGIPFTKKYIAYTDTFGEYTDVWSVSLSDDPHYHYRLVFVMMGLLLTVIAAMILFISFANKEYVKFHFLNTLLMVLIFSIGVKGYPYWINGIEHAKYGGHEGGYDPKALLPMNITGEWITVVILLFYIFCCFGLPLLIVRKVVLILSRKEIFNPYRITIDAVIICLIVYSFYITPTYFYWIID